jgi:hypothetical protein
MPSRIGADAMYHDHKEEDEGYLAAEAGESQSDNPYPRGTLRHEHWRDGWLARVAEVQRTIRLGRTPASGIPDRRSDIGTP